MNLDEFENKLRSQPRREIPVEWRREILGPLRATRETPAAWWRQLLWPHPAAWASLAAAWVAIVALNFGAAEDDAPGRAAAKPAADSHWAYEERKRLYAELVLELLPPARSEPADRPRSHLTLAEVAV
jgi:hypothetical protein